jgi:predicted amidohydrolase
MRIGGAQIPVTRNVIENVTTIKQSIDWAADNNVDWLLTPEGSVSGYLPTFDTYNGGKENIEKGVAEVVDYAKDKNVSLALGTLFVESEPNGDLRRNQIRYYQQGILLGVTNKSYTVPYDVVVADYVGNPSVINIAYEELAVNNVRTPTQYKAIGLICNDMWGNHWEGGPSIMKEAQKLNCDFVFHASNGGRGNGHDVDELYNLWHEAHLRMLSHLTRIPIITVDNCNHMNGDHYEGPTASQSGVVLGDWLVKVPRKGVQHFYWDYNPGRHTPWGYKPAEGFEKYLEQKIRVEKTPKV